jgi:hypothetical protein
MNPIMPVLRGVVGAGIKVAAMPVPIMICLDSIAYGN